jgi:hypothetical protein
MVVMFIGMQFVLNFSSISSNRHHFASMQDIMIPPVIPGNAAALKDDSGRKVLSAAAVSAFHLQDLETERLHFEDNTYHNINNHDDTNSSQGTKLCPLMPPKLGEFIVDCNEKHSTYPLFLRRD